MAHLRRGVGVRKAKPRPSASASTESSSNLPPPSYEESSFPSNPSTSTSTYTYTQQPPQTSSNNTSNLASKLKHQEITHIQTSLETLTNELHNFSLTNATALQNDPAFRSKFLSLCAPLGVDPLSSTRSTSTGYGKFLGGGGGGVGGFYNELSLKLLEVCMSTTKRTGGVISCSELLDILNKRKLQRRMLKDAKTKSVLEDKYFIDDLLLSIKKLSVLGSGLRLVTLETSDAKTGTKKSSVKSSEQYVITTPVEFSLDSIKILSLASSAYGGNGSVTMLEVKYNYNWSIERVERGIELLVSEGVAWIDDSEIVETQGKGGKGERRFWFPSVWRKNNQAAK